jgi:hypothetical protein
MFWTIICHSASIEFLFRRKRQATPAGSSNYTDRIGPNDLPDSGSGTVPESPLHPNLTWPTANNITEADAQHACSSAILNSSVYWLCINYTYTTINATVDSCIKDVQVYQNSIH